tara:strand:- start:144 stop:842 length:699 start_codon:yes stop_codon:yes gene_type:complete
MFISIIGPKGLIGKQLVKNFNEKKGVKILKVGKSFDFSKVQKKYKIVIHAANSGKKFEAKKNPRLDYENSVKLTNKIAKIFKDRKIILISTISCRTENNVYSKHRKLCENIILKSSKKNVIFRLPVILNTKSKRGILYDLSKNKKIYSNKNSIVNPVTIDQICYYIFKNLNSKRKIHEIGSYENIELFELAKIINSKSKFVNRETNLLAKPSLKIFSLKNIINELINHKKNG